MGELRNGSRISYQGRVAITWTDGSGNPCSALGDCLDISEKGMKVSLNTPLEVRAYVSIRFAGANLHGSASVRSSVHRKVDYIACLEFTGGMKWPNPLI